MRPAHPRSRAAPRPTPVYRHGMRVQLLCPPPSLEGPWLRPRHAPHHAAIVAAALREAGHSVRLIDEALRTTAFDQLPRDCARAEPDVVLVMQGDYNRAIQPAVLDHVLAGLREAMPDTPIFGVSRLREDAAVGALGSLPHLPGLVFGEPEFSAVALLEGLESNDLGSVPGLALRIEHGIASTPQPPVDLDDSPVPAWDLLDLSDYGFRPHQGPDDVTWPVLASRGCPYSCFWCEVQARPNWLTRSPQVVVDEVAELHRRFGARTFFLADPLFGVRRSWVLDFCARLRDAVLPIRWSCMTRTDHADPELMQAMADAGCINVLFGVESLNPYALERAGKALDPATVGPAIQAAQAAGLEAVVSVMIGLPGDTPGGVERTLDGVIAMEPDYAQFFVVQVPPAAKHPDGRLVGGWEGGRFDFPGHAFAPEAFGPEAQLRRLQRRAYRRFYLRPGYIGRRAGRIWQRGEAGVEARRLVRGAKLAVRMALGSQPAR